MLRHIVIRSLMIIPTLLIVSVITFALSVCTPGDSIEQALALEGVTLEDDRISQSKYEKEYAKKAIELKKDKPLFYFSIQPNNRPIYEQWSTIPIYQRNKLEALVDNNIPLVSAKKFVSAVDTYEGRYFVMKDSLTTQMKLDWKQSILLLNKPNDLIPIRKQLIYLANEYQDTPYVDDITDLMIAIPVDATNEWHIPSISWHGTDNQYHSWIANFITGNYGLSILDSQPVFNKIWDAIKWTALLVIMGLFFSLLVSIPLALLSAHNVNGIWDRWISWISLSIYSVPIFWMATILIVYFTTDTYSSWLDIFPSPTLFYSESDTSIIALLGKYFNRLLLPVICISMKDIAYLVRVIRADLIKESTKEYATTLRAKGVSKWNAMWKHILPNSLISTITVIITNIPAALAGTLIIEVIFNIPGMGRLMHNSILQSDWNVVYAVLLLISFVTVLFYLIGDIIYAMLNPRISFENE